MDRSFRYVWVLLLAPTLVCLLAPRAIAQATLTWNGSVSSVWTVASNWTPSAVPGPSDTAIIPGGTPNAPTATGTVSIAGLAMQSASHLRVLGTPAAHAQFTVASGFTNNGTIELGNTGSTQRAELTVTAGTLINMGLILSTSGTATTDPNRLNAEIDNRTIIRVERALSVNRPGAVHRNGGALELVGADVTFTQTGEDAALYNTGSVELAAGRTLAVIGGAFHHDGLFNVPGNARGTVALTNVAVHLLRVLRTERLNVSATGTTVHGPSELIHEEGSTITLANSTINAAFLNHGLAQAHGNGGIGGTSFTNSSTGVLQVLGTPAAHARLTVASGFANHGEIELGNTGSTQRGELSVTAGPLVNHGAIYSRTGTATTDPNRLDAALDNRGTLAVERALTVNKPDAIHRNTGLIEVSGGNLTITQTGELAAFLQDGSVQIDAGRTLTISGSTVFIQGGSISGSEPTILGQVGVLSLASTTLNVTPDFESSDLDLVFTNAVVHGPGRLTNGPGRTLTLSNATVNADLVNRGTLRAVGNSAIAGESFSNEAGGALHVLGTPAAHARLTVANGFTNAGEVELGNTGSTQRGELAVADGPLINAGVIASRSGTATADPNRLDAALDNRGTLAVERALTIAKADARHANTGRITVYHGNVTVSLAGSAEFENAGRITVHGGQTLTFTGGSLTNAPSGIFHGGGTLSVAGTSVNNSGTFAPGLRPMFGVNLIANGDAERGPTGSSADNVSIAGWTDSGPMSILPYGFQDASQPFLASTDPGPTDRGTRYFWGGVGASSAITQTINLADISTLVDLGGVTYELSGWLGGFSVQNDQMQLTASFRDGEGEQLAAATLDPVTAADRGFETALLLREAEGTLPVGTRSVLLTLTSTRFAGTANNGFADALSLVLHPAGGSEEGRTTGILSVTGDFPMAPDHARVEVAIGGLEAGAEYDRVAVTGAADLAGSLHVTMINGFVPTAGDEFTVMTFGSREGEFPSVTVSGLPEGLFLNPEYSAGGVILRASGEGAGPSQPVLTSPVNGATDVSVAPTLRWQGAAGAVSYHVQLATDAAFSAVVFEEDDHTAASVEPGELSPATPYYWRVRASDGEGFSPWSQAFTFTTGAAVSTGGGPEAPLAFSLEPNHPNPFAHRTTIRFGLPEGRDVRLEVFDMLGRRVAVLVDAPLTPGFHDLPWETNGLPSGPYVYRLTAGDFVAVRKALLVRQ